ncbi:UNVERIFIED_CONTAM: hypothetical protein PYX00_009637 [Menopon gallinae]|uniref:Uncharacterized protein n=1 Tax=Menopon gallinae TaxID=328185 RepID=A0AAW2HBN5_9NEOP
MTKINYANGKSYGRELTYGSYSRYSHENAVRHHHNPYRRSYYRRPYPMKSHAKRTPRKFVVLDQIDHRLNNAVDYFNEKHPRTTSNPLDYPYDLKSFARMYMTNSVHAPEDEKASQNRIDHGHKHVKESVHSWDKLAFDDVDAIADSRGYLQDVTTSKPPSHSFVDQYLPTMAGPGIYIFVLSSDIRTGQQPPKHGHLSVGLE